MSPLEIIVTAFVGMIVGAFLSAMVAFQFVRDDCTNFGHVILVGKKYVCTLAQ